MDGADGTSPTQQICNEAEGREKNVYRKEGADWKIQGRTLALFVFIQSSTGNGPKVFRIVMEVDGTKIRQQKWELQKGKLIMRAIGRIMNFLYILLMWNNLLV
jgi:hypothetical protein